MNNKKRGLQFVALFSTKIMITHNEVIASVSKLLQRQFTKFHAEGLKKLAQIWQKVCCLVCQLC